MSLGDTEKRFIVHWGEMGQRWGINRTMAQIHALLYLAPQPLHAEEIVESLGVARSNVSTSVRELQAWGVVRLVHVFGDRRDHFESETDVWTLFRRVIDERKKREIDPTIDVLRRCVAEAPPGTVTRQRLDDMLGLFEISASWYGVMSRLSNRALTRFLRMGERVPRMLGVDEE